MSLTLRYVARSDVGLVRDENEDSGYAGPRLLAVADGMGGHAAGEIASSATIDELVRVENGMPDGDPHDLLHSAVVAANDRIRALVQDDPDREGMGTTLTALLWTSEGFHIAHIGDSRAYLLREGKLRQLTHDHTFVQTLIDEGRITPDDAVLHPARSLILKALDGKPNPEPDLDVLPVHAGDRVLVCSDGLSGVVSDETLRETLGQQPAVAEAADELVELAMRSGAPDNITVVVAEVVETDAPRREDDTAEVYLVGAASGEQRPAKSPRRRPGAALRGMLGSGGHGSDPDTTPAPADPEELRYAPQPPRRFRWLRRLAIVAVIAAVAWIGGTVANQWVRSQYYVAEQSGEVAIFRGVSQEVGPLRLSELHETADGLPVEALPDVFRGRVDATMSADSLADAERIVANLREEACAAQAASEESAGVADEPSTAGTDTFDSPDSSNSSEHPGLRCPEDP